MATSPSLVSTYEYTPIALPTSSKHEFRLLRLHPGKEDTEISCDLEVADLENSLPYEALSYTWGDPKGPECDIPCRGDLKADYYIKVHGKGFRVGYNLMSALQHLRLETSPRIMWIDAICINQTDNEEKSYQVRSMHKIYSLATGVIAWIGEEDDYTDLAFDTIEEIVWAKRAMFWKYCSVVLNKPLAEITKNDFHNICKSAETRDKSKVDIYDPLTDIILYNHVSRKFFFDAMWSTPPFSNIAYDSLDAMALAAFGSSRFLARQLVSDPDESFLGKLPSNTMSALAKTFNSRKYWSRLWIVQEILLASHISFQSGRRHLDMDSFNVALLVYYTVDYRSVSVNTLNNLIESIGGAIKFAVLRYLDKGLFDPVIQLSLSHWVSRTAFEQECLDSRDKFYALMGISAPIDIPIDYTLSVGEVFAQATKKIMNQDNSLDFMLQYQGEALRGHFQGRPDSPTWVPRLHKPFLNLNGSPMLEPFYRCGGSLETKYDITGDLFSLKIEGYFHGELKITSSIYDEDSRWKAALKLRQSLNIDSAHQNNKHRWQDSLSLPFHRKKIVFQDHIFWSTLVRDTYKDTTYVTSRIKGNQELESEFARDIQAALVSSSPTKKLLGHLESSVSDEIFCVTSDNKMALVYGGAQKGDHVFLAKGASLPLIIRPIKPPRQGFLRTKGEEKKKKEEQEYVLVCSAFIYEYMDGEPFKELEGSDRPRDKVILV